MSTSNSSQNIVWVNGEYRDSADLPISATDPGLTVGMGVFDSLCSYEGRPFDFAQHYSRLSASADKLSLTLPAKEVLLEALNGVIQKGLFLAGKCRLRITLLDGNEEPICIVSAASFPERSELSTCVTARSRVNERSLLSGIKSTCYALNSLELRAAAAAGADEAILCNTSDLLCEGATSNIFLVQNGEVHTPSLNSGCLPGVARYAVIQLCKQLGLAVVERDVRHEELMASDEVFLTSSLREVQGVAILDGQQIATEAGPITSQLKQAYKQRVINGAQ